MSLKPGTWRSIAWVFGLIFVGLGVLNMIFILLQLKEEIGTQYDSQSGTWEHYTACMPPWMYLWSRKK